MIMRMVFVTFPKKYSTEKQADGLEIVHDGWMAELAMTPTDLKMTQVIQSLLKRNITGNLGSLLSTVKDI